MSFTVNSKQKQKTLFNPVMQGLTPFACTVESSRLNMQVKYWTQVVTSENVDNPFIVNPEITNVADTNDHFKLHAEEDSVIVYDGNNVIIMYLKKSKKLKTIYVPKYMNASGASYNLYYKTEKKEINEGELIYSYAPLDIENKVPKNGYRVKSAFMPFFGFTTEDSYVISDNFAKRAKITTHEKVFIPISKGLKYFKQFESEGMIPHVGCKIDSKKGIYSYIPFEESRNMIIDLSNISDHEVKMFMKKFKSDISGTVTDVKIHKVKSSIDLQGENLINKNLYDELDREYNDMYDKVKKEFDEGLSLLPENIRSELSEGVIDTHVFIKKLSQNSLTNKFKTMMDDLKITDVDYVIELDIARENETAYGDKFTSMYAGKGTVGLIIPSELTPVTEKGEAIDVMINPIGIFGRNNWGIIIETMFGKIIKDIESDVLTGNKEKVLEKLEFIMLKYTSIEFKLDAKAIADALDSIRDNYDKFVDNVEKNGLFLWSAAFSNFSFKQIIKEIMVPYQETFDVNLVKKEKLKLSKELLEWVQATGLDSGCIEIDGDIWVEVYTGWDYYMKLYHTADSKYNFTNFAGKYTVTGQPVRGRRNQGGGHISWQTLGALFAAGATDIIKEMYTIKSDCLNDKNDFMTNMIQGEYNLKNKYHSRTKDTVNVYLKLFGLTFD